MPTLTIVSPFFNEVESAQAYCGLVEKLEQELSARFGLQIDKILVDDGSTDGGAAVFAAHLKGAWRIVQLSRNFGKESALLAGIDNAAGDFVLLMDSDLQHSGPASIRLVEEIVADPELDVVYAVRADRRASGLWRWGAARLLYRLMNKGQRFAMAENAGDFRVMRRRAVDAFAQLRDRRRFNKGLFAWIGFRQKGIAYTPDSRTGGRTKWSPSGLIALAMEGVTSFSVVPLRIVSGAGLLVAAGGFLYGIKIVLEVLFYGIAVPGFPSVLVAVTVLGGFNLALLGLLGEYLWVTLSETKDRPIYLVREVMQSAPAEHTGVPLPERHAR
jgi:glycosyltransferase involved in cell wall biosynthesis